MTKTTEIGGVELTDKEIADAKKEGVKDVISDRMLGAVLTDTGTKADLDDAADEQRFRVRFDLESTFIAPLLDLGVDELKDRLTDQKREDFIAFEDAKGLLHLERSGKNRTPYVKMLMKVIGVDDPYKVSPAGPPYTNDATNVSKL